LEHERRAAKPRAREAEMGAYILYVGTFLAMTIALIVAVHRTIVAEDARVAKSYNKQQLLPPGPQEAVEAPAYKLAA
jgi:hypothetical protein